MEERRKETATILLCRCGWMAVGASFGEVNDEYELHTAGRLGHKDERYIPIANPVIPEAIALFKKQAIVRGDESRALDFVERYRGATVDEMWNDERVDAGIGDDMSVTLKRFTLRCAVLGMMGLIAELAWMFLR